LPWPTIHCGTPSWTETVQRIRVRPAVTSTEPAGWSVKARSKRIGRGAVSVRSSARLRSSSVAVAGPGRGRSGGRAGYRSAARGSRFRGRSGRCGVEQLGERLADLRDAEGLRDDADVRPLRELV